MSNLAQLMKELKEEGIKLGFEVNIAVFATTEDTRCSQTTPAVEIEVEEKETEVEPAPKKRTRKKPVPKKTVVEEPVEEEEQEEAESEEQAEEADSETPKLEDLIKQTKKAIGDHGKVAVKSILDEFAVSKLTELDEEYYAEYKDRLGEECP